MADFESKSGRVTMRYTPESDNTSWATAIKPTATADALKAICDAVASVTANTVKELECTVTNMIR